MNYRWSSSVYSLQHVIESEDFPCTIKVEDSQILNVTKGQIYRLDTYACQIRYVVEDVHRNAYSIPEHYPFDFKSESGREIANLRKCSASDLPQSIELDPKSNSSEIMKHGKSFKNLTILEKEEVAYAVVSDINERGCINFNMSAMSSRWPVWVRVADPKSIQLCRGCTEQLNHRKLAGSKKAVAEPDSFILRLCGKTLGKESKNRKENASSLSAEVTSVSSTITKRQDAQPSPQQVPLRKTRCDKLLKESRSVPVFHDEQLDELRTHRSSSFRSDPGASRPERNSRGRDSQSPSSRNQSLPTARRPGSESPRARRQVVAEGSGYIRSKVLEGQVYPWTHPHMHTGLHSERRIQSSSVPDKRRT